MCGITGWVDLTKDVRLERPILERMVKTLAHRGPDAEGRWLSEHAAIGHRRLSVVDPAGGGQPMTRRYGDRVYVITYNGELYNTPELRQELEKRGHIFHTHSDTEVLLVSYIEWGGACVERFNGIFAFGIWDEAVQRLFMARDRVGVKPLFYSLQGSAFIFGSEVKAILAHPAAKPEVDTEGLAEIFLTGPARTPGHGIFKGMAELKPGHSLFYDHSGIHHRRYWSLVSKPHGDGINETAAKVTALLRDTVRRQLVADVPVCTLLSGGLDSSALSALAAESYAEHGLPALRTFSVDYVGNDRNFRANAFQPTSDAPWVALMSSYLKTNHRTVLVDTPRLVEALGAAVRANDRPGMADVDSSLLLFCREIKQEATVALSGESADEIFGGYPWFRTDEALIGNSFPWARYISERASLLEPGLTARLKPEEYVAQRYHEALAEVPRLPGENALATKRRELFYLNITRFMPTLLDRKDRMSMASGLEVRVPFCDHRLIEYVWNIPWEIKTAGGMEKGILRQACTGLVPDEVLFRRKSPYPKTHNPSYLSATKAWLTEILADPAAPIRQLINLRATTDLLATDAAQFGPAWFGQLMGGAQLFAYLAQVDTWLREYRVSIV